MSKILQVLCGDVVNSGTDTQHRFFLEEVPETLVSRDRHRCHIASLDSPGFSQHLKMTGGLPSENIECYQQTLARRIFLVRMMHEADAALFSVIAMSAVEYNFGVAFPLYETLLVYKCSS